MNHTHLKSMVNGRVFLHTDMLAKRGDMIPCDADGNIATGHVGPFEQSGKELIKSKYLGNMENGGLYPWTEYLAKRGDMINIDSPEQWEAMRETGEAPKQAENTIIPSLRRTEPVKEEVSAEVIAETEDKMPSIKDLPPREAKIMLAEWAEKQYHKKIDKRKPLPEVIEVCEKLAG